MAYEKLKSENYANLGGMNTKVSQYITTQNEFLNLQNVDFRLMGALSTFAGSTQYSTVSATSPINGIVDYSVGFNSGTTFSLATQTFAILTTDSYHLSNATGGTGYQSLLSYIYTCDYTNPFSFTKSQYLHGANGFDAFTYPGPTYAATAFQFGLPKPFFPTFSGFSFSYGASVAGQSIAGNLNMLWAWKRCDGLIGPPLAVSLLILPGQITSNVFLNSATLFSSVGANGLSLGSFGISQILLWARLGTVTADWVFINGVAPGSAINIAQGSIFNTNNSGLTLPPDDYFGTFVYGFSNWNGSFWNPALGLGQTTVPNIPAVTGSNNPSLMESYGNRVFVGGFARYPNRYFYSEIGQPENFPFDNFDDVVSNDGDVVSCFVSYFTQLVVFKTRSTWAVSGDPTQNGPIEVTPIYGCLSARGACVWEQKLWFLDEKGICEFNGANTQIVSNNVQPIFERMNVQAARSQAIIVHVKERNEVWCAIPIDGSLTNNAIVVYDYLANAWTVRTTPNALTALSAINFGNAKTQIFAGGSSGTITQFGSSLTTENGAGLTQVIKSRFIGDMGHSVEKMFRRIYLDAKVPQGSTQVFAVNFYTNQGVSPALQTTMTLSSFQNRIDFGLSARDISVELIYSGAQFLQLNGFTIEYRFQRAV